MHLNNKIRHLKCPFGVEIEFDDIDINQVNYYLKKLKLRHPIRCRNTDRNSNGLYWDLKLDGSVSGEVASPILHPGKISFNEIKQVHSAIIEAGGNFYKHCGLHMHVDISNIDKFKVILSILKHEENLYKGFSSYRKRTEFAQPWVKLTPVYFDKDLPEKLRQILRYSCLEYNDKWSAIRFYKRKNKQMVEFRMGESTKDIKLTLNWIKQVLLIINYAKTINITKELFVI